MCSVPAWERALAARKRMSEDTERAQRLRHLRDRLCMLLEDSDLCDARHVLEQIASTELWDEQVILHSKVGAHPAENLALTHMKLLLQCRMPEHVTAMAPLPASRRQRWP